MTDFCTIYVTCKDREEASVICRYLLKENLIACGNIIDGATSIYQWQGKICEDQEAILFLKTTQNKSKEAIKLIKKHHSYDVPCICTWNIEGGNDQYLEWLRGEVL